MNLTRTVRVELREVQLGAVSFVLAETVFREASAEFAHHHVTRDLRDHARRGDAEAVAVAVDDGGLREREGEHRQSVDQRVVRLRGESGDCFAHRAFLRSFLHGMPVSLQIDIDYFDCCCNVHYNGRHHHNGRHSDYRADCSDGRLCGRRVYPDDNRDHYDFARRRRSPIKFRFRKA